MGTRSLTHFLEDGASSPTLATLYTHSDGYPAVLGLDLARFLSKYKVVNGIVWGHADFNGMGDLVVRAVTALKGDAGYPGQHYLQHPGTSGMDEDYVYTVYVGDKGVPHIQCRRKSTGSYELLFDGPASDFDRFVDANTNSSP